ncbi:MAG TPA: putative glycoside hydrolase, partial [Gemmatimonadaceae bacterium]|nr:putative glycoside hydrolase [Gemmatimonadaceae bacterium]
MRALRLSVLALAALACAGGDRSPASAAKEAASTPPAAAPASHRDTGRVSRAESRPAAPADTSPPVVDTSAPPPRPARVRHLATPDPMRGLYVSRAVAQGPGVWRLVELARHTSVNALVFDVKDDQGIVLYPSTVGLAHLIGADAVHPMPVARLHALIDSLRKYRIYAVARIVVARDPILAAKRPQWGLVHRADDPERNAWVDPRRREIWAYAADLASEAAARGFSAVQFDDAQFPPSKGLSERLELRSLSGPTAGEVIRAQLGFLASRLDPVGVPM